MNTKYKIEIRTVSHETLWVYAESAENAMMDATKGFCFSRSDGPLDRSFSVEKDSPILMEDEQ
jgi:hypothetical protein